MLFFKVTLHIRRNSITPVFKSLTRKKTNKNNMPNSNPDISHYYIYSLTSKI